MDRLNHQYFSIAYFSCTPFQKFVIFNLCHMKPLLYNKKQKVQLPTQQCYIFLRELTISNPENAGPSSTTTTIFYWPSNSYSFLLYFFLSALSPFVLFKCYLNHFLHRYHKSKLLLYLFQFSSFLFPTYSLFGVGGGGGVALIFFKLV